MGQFCTTISVLFLLLLLNFFTSNCFSTSEETFSTSDFTDELRIHARAYGMEKEFELLKEAFDRIINGGIGEFDASVDPGRFGNRTKPEPDCYRNVTELITSKGYGCEEHYTATSDGYVLALQRILPKSGVPNNSSKVVLLQHGLLDSATTWVINQDYNSLGFMLVDAGLDVWLSNSRGNKYSHTNIHCKSNERKFWEFSWDEMASIDLYTFVDYVTLHSGVDKIHFVGHSQGTLTAFVGFSQNQTLADKIEQFYALAPIITVGNVEGPIKFLAQFHKMFYDFLNLIGYEEVLPNNLGEQILGRTLCSISPLTCELAAFFIAGKDFTDFNKTRSDVYFSHYPAGTSLRTINHWAQMIESGKTQMYDFGKIENEKHYGQSDAPVYNVTGLSVLVSIFYGGSDFLGDEKDVEILKQTIPNVIVYQQYLKKYNHLDFVWGMTAYKKVYNVIIKQILDGVGN